jgi:REP element-mobilizing transposase RayT
MSRPLRIQFGGAVYHVMNRGAAKQSTFHDNSDYQAFLDTVAEAHRRWGIEVFAYSLMRNHYHLCLRTPKGNLSRVMRHIDGIYTQRFNRRHGRDGTLFRGRYKAILVDVDEYLAAVVRYIHLNAVEAGIVKLPEDYAWASHRHYVASRGMPGWLQTRDVMDQIGDRKSFHEFVLSGNEESLKRYYETERRAPVLGSEQFIERLPWPDRAATKEHARYERRVVQVGPEDIIAEVARQYKVSRDEVFRRRRGKENEAGKVAMYLVRRCCDWTLSETAKYFGAGSYAAVSWSCRVIDSRIAKDKKMRERIEKIALRNIQLQT